MNVDIETYDFDTLKEEDLGALLDEDINDLNDETFGGLNEAAPVGRDFDFAGSTSRFMGQDAPAAAPPSTKAAPSWSAFDDDPLLSGRPLPKQPNQPQQQQQPQRHARTLEEIEAEMMAQQQPQAQPARKALTLEEVEAEMLKQQQQPQHMSPPQPQNMHMQQPMMMMQPPPPGFPHQQHYPPGMMPPRFVPPMQQQQQQQQQFHHQMPPMPMMQQIPQPFGTPMSPMPMPQQLQQQQQQQQKPVQSNVLETLFPPLPTQQQGGQAGIAAVAQQLQYLSLNQKNQHPSLTGAQLQALLQQAQRHAAAAAASVSAASDAEKSNDEAAAAANDDEKAKMARASSELIKAVEERIREHEVVEARRRKTAAKVAQMARHNGLMSESDKHFITRIQVSQLVTDDPYADDFYFHIMTAIKINRAEQAANRAAAAAAAASQQEPRPTPGRPGQNGDEGTGKKQQRKGPNRRDTAMNRMAQNVQRLIDSAKQKNKTAHGQLTVDGALGKIAVRTRSAPRQLLQVGNGKAAASGAAGTAHQTLLADLLSGGGGAGQAASTSSSGGTSAGKPLDRRALLVVVEDMYDIVLDLEQMKRIHPRILFGIEQLERVVADQPEADEPKERLEEMRGNLKRWERDYAEKVDNLWRAMHVMDPLDACVPHPFVAILSLAKGKRVLPRAMRHLSSEQNLTILTLLVATFNTLDVVADAPKLDEVDPRGGLENRRMRQEVHARTEAFLHATVSPLMAVINNAPLRMITGLIGLLMDRNDIFETLKSKPGVTLLTLFLSRAASLKTSTTTTPDASDLAQWQQTFSHLFNTLSTDLPSLFPSTRAAASLPFGVAHVLLHHHDQQQLELARPDMDRDDEPVWQMLAACAVNADLAEQQTLVSAVRDKVLENVQSAHRRNSAAARPGTAAAATAADGAMTDPIAALKIRNVNLLLHSLGLDASQLTVDS